MHILFSMKRSEHLHVLSHQHHNGLMAVLLLKKGIAKNADIYVMQDFILQLWENELRKHFLAEELELNPDLLELPEIADLYQRMKEEHAQIRALILQLKSAPAATEQIRNFYELLEQHIRFEERELFERIQVHVTPGVLEQVGKRLEALPTGSCDRYPVKFWE